MHHFSKYEEAFSSALLKEVPESEPRQLYEPIRYILEIGGKRVRPLLTLMAADIFGATLKRALPAALAVEVFHNFSLVHDDIMDQAPLRRGRETVHLKWDVNTAILSGDAMLILAYRHFEEYEPEVFSQLAKLFSKTALEVCEGQQWDVEFETREQVSEGEYLEMIRCKTAVLLGAALKMGAIVAGARTSDSDAIYEFGLNLGMAFQIQDDYLDAYGDPATFGKQVGGDIMENKKTYLYIKALELADNDFQNTLLQHYRTTGDDHEKVASVTDIFTHIGADKAAEEAIVNYTQRAMDCISQMEISAQAAQELKNFGESLMQRQA